MAVLAAQTEEALSRGPSAQAPQSFPEGFSAAQPLLDPTRPPRPPDLTQQHLCSPSCSGQILGGDLGLFVFLSPALSPQQHIRSLSPP